jgi:hypothetical protein
MPAWMPVPVIAIVSGEPGALLVTVMLPVGLPVAAGANFAVIVVFPPAAIVMGSVNPLTEYPVPEAVRAEIVNDKLPVLLSVIVCELLLPTRTLPKLSLVGFAVRLDWTPVPVMAIVVGDDAALLVIEMLPAGLPVAAGANLAVNVEFAPAAIEIGSVNPLTE